MVTILWSRRVYTVDSTKRSTEEPKEPTEEPTKGSTEDPK